MKCENVWLRNVLGVCNGVMMCLAPLKYTFKKFT